MTCRLGGHSVTALPLIAAKTLRVKQQIVHALLSNRSGSIRLRFASKQTEARRERGLSLCRGGTRCTNLTPHEKESRGHQTLSGLAINLHISVSRWLGLALEADRVRFEGSNDDGMIAKATAFTVLVLDMHGFDAVQFSLVQYTQHRTSGSFRSLTTAAP